MKKLQRVTSRFLLVCMLLSILPVQQANALAIPFAGTATRTSETEAMVTFTSDVAGTYYTEVVEDNAAEPTIDTSGSGTDCDTSQQTILLTALTAGAKDIYIVVKDTSENQSAALKIDIPAYDGTAPSLTAGTATRTSETEAMVTFTSDAAGTYFTEVVEDNAAEPTIDTSGSGTDCDTSQQTILLSALTAGAKDIYVVVKDASENHSAALKIDIPAYDGTAPSLTAGTATRTSETEAMVTFTSDAAGTYFTEVVEDNAAEPTIDTSGSGTDCDTSQQTILLTALTAGAKDIYIVVKDASENQSAALKIDIPPYEAEGGNLYITEIYPNDVDRTSVYGNSSDQMEYVELTNTMNRDISFNDEYGLYYEYPSGSTYKLKQLTVTAADGSSDITIIAGETVVLWDRRDDLDSHASEADFRSSWLIPDDVQVLVAAGQAGFGEDGRGFTVKTLSTGDIISHFRYTTAVDTSDGLAVHLSIPDSGYEMNACVQNSFGSPGAVCSDQINQETTAPDNLTPQGLYITEIRPNDTARGGDYGDTAADDFMECCEIFNTTDNDIDFDKDYEFAYLYKSSYLVQPISTIKTDENGNEYVDPSDTSGVIIPAHGSAIIWCYRAVGLAGSYTSFPTVDDFREAYNLTENEPVYAQTGQNGWANTARGIALLRKNADGSRTNESYYFWNGVTDLADNKSVDLKVSSDGPKMSIYKALSTTNMGVVAQNQYEFYADDGSSPVLELLDDSSTMNQGEFLRIPYSYAGSSALPVESIALYYKTDSQDSYTVVPTSSFAIYNKYYAFVDNAELLEANYVDYYLKASNAYHTTTTEERRITILKKHDYDGLRVNFNGEEAKNDAVLSGTAEISAKNFADISEDIAFKLDGEAATASDSLERCAYFTFDYSGVDSYYKNGLTIGDETNGKVISVFAKCSEIPTTDSLAIPVSQSLFTTNADGSASIELALRAGTYGSTWEADTTANNDDFTAGNFALHLPDGTILSPVTTVNMNGNSLDPAAMTKLGDSSTCTICVVMTFTIPADKVDASSFALDTTALTDGSHTLSVVSGSKQKDVTFTVDNSAPEEPKDDTIDVNVQMSTTGTGSAVASVYTGSDVSTVTVYEAKTISGVTVKEGAGDSTATAAEKTGSGATESDNGEYPYQILEIPVTDQSIDALRIAVDAQVNYSQPVQLYILNTGTGEWDIIDNTTDVGGVTTGVCQMEGHAADGVSKVLVQARGAEYTPYTQANNFKTTKTDYAWDGTGVPEQYDFAVAWFSDMQYYSEQYLWHFTNITNWIVDNADQLNIKYAVTTGDIVDEFNEEYEYQNASQEFAKLENAKIPYGVLAGNHDVAHGNMRYDLYWKYFGADRYEDSPVYGGTYNKNLGHYDLVTINGEELLFLYISWDVYVPEADWMNSVLAQYPDRKAIICTHCGINASAVQSYTSDFLLNHVCQENPNVFAIINGHYHGSSLNFVGFDDTNDGVNDRVVYQICTDYQSASEGGAGYIKMIYFDLANDKIYMNSYSPSLSDYNYYDTPKLESYGEGTIATDIDIAELSVDFDRDTKKTLDVASVSVTGLTSTQLGSAARSGSTTPVTLAASVGGTKNAYAVLKDSSGNILGYTDALSFSVTQATSSSDDTTSDSGTTNSSGTGTSSSSQGNTTTSSTNITGTTDNSGKTTASVNAETASALIGNAKSAEEFGKKAVVEIAIETTASATAAEVSIPKNSFQHLAEDTSADLTVNAGIGTITFNASAVDAIHSAASGDVKISIAKADTSGISSEVMSQIGSRPVYDFTVTTGNNRISSFGGGRVSISLPYRPATSEDPNAIVVYYVGDSGQLQTVRGNYNASTGMVEFITTHFSTYAVGYNKISFGDVASTAWYKDAVTFLSARGIATGTSANTFSPDTVLTRGQFIVMLMRAYGIEADKNPTDNFDDAGNTYYTNYLAAAKKLGISGGVGDNKFAPDSEITRQDMFTLLYRALGVLNELPAVSTNNTIHNFDDADQVSAYAREAMNVLIQAGMIAGNNGNLDPAGTSTRAQMAQVLYRLLSA